MNVLGLTSLIITFILLLVPIKITAQNQDKTFCVLHNFGAPNSKDAIWNLWPGAMAVTDDGSIWTAVNRGGSFDLGAVIKITPEGNYLKVADLDAATGGHPQGGLVNGNNGYLYGTTSEGGRWGAGTIFRVSAHGGSPEVIYDFRNGRSTLIKPEGECTTPQNCKYSPDQIANMSAANPISSPVVVNGNLYGVTPYSNHQQYGTLYTISLATTPRPNPIDGKTPEDGDKQFKVQCIFQPSLAKDPDMKRFRCNTNGTNAGLLIAGQNGKLYGTTYWTETARHGTVFEATTGGVVTSIHEFNSTDGSGPIALMYGSDGKLYGTTVNGGRANAGVVFKIDRVGLKFDVITDFPNPSHNEYVRGGTPVAGIVEGEDGNLYGALQYGGLYNGGVLYRVAKEKNADGDYDFRILRDFESLSSGRNPVSLAMIGKDFIYGTTFQGGAFGGGSLFRYRTGGLAVGAGLNIAHNDIIEVRALAMGTQAGDSGKSAELNDGIAVHLKCDTDPHFVQFIYREMIQLDKNTVAPGAEPFPNGKLLPFDFGYPATTLLTDIHWKPDRHGKAGGSPFYDQTELDCDSLTLIDRPEIKTTLAHNIYLRAVARDYAICGGQVLGQVSWISDQTLGEDQKMHFTYQATVNKISNNKIPDYFLCLLKNNGYDLPSGQSISAGVDCAQLPPAILGKP